MDVKEVLTKAADTLAPGRTKFDVVNAFRKAAENAAARA